MVDTLTATPEHPFYVPGQGMTALGKLGIGTLVVTRAGPPVVVHSLVRQHSAAGVAVYNLEVEGDHTYFVGNSGEWVHNNCTTIAKSLLSKAGEGSIISVRNKIKGLLLEEGGWSYHDAFLGTDGKVIDPMRPQANGLPFDDWVQSWQYNQEYDFDYRESFSYPQN